MAQEVDVDVVTHWGCQMLHPDGRIYITRWNPTYGGLHLEPYTEAEARADVARSDGRYGGDDILVNLDSVYGRVNSRFNRILSFRYDYVEDI